VLNELSDGRVLNFHLYPMQFCLPRSSDAVFGNRALNFPSDTKVMYNFLGEKNTFVTIHIFFD